MFVILHRKDKRQFVADEVDTDSPRMFDSYREARSHLMKLLQTNRAPFNKYYDYDVFEMKMDDDAV